MKIDINKKQAAIRLRRRGRSIRDIENLLGVPRSTLSGWLRDVKLSEKQKERLHKNWLNALVKARLKASKVHRDERLQRIKRIEKDARHFVSNITVNKTMGELIFAAFYLAEGSKSKGAVEIANTNPDILVAFWRLFQYLYPVDKSKFRCYLHLRLDQSERQLKNYWSKVLGIPKSQFIKSQIDKRAIRPTFKGYKGVCTVYYCDVNLQRRILAIGEEFLRKTKKHHKEGS